MEWKFPVDLPRFTNEEFERKKAKYVAKHGYTVSPPHLKDIIHIRWHKEPDEEEFKRYKSASRLTYLIEKYPGSKNVPKWKKERDSLISTKRYYEIDDIMRAKRRRYRQILASPTPTWLANIGSVMTFFDDINDMVGTVGVVGRIAAHLLPGVLARVLLGPVGWLFLIADILNILMSAMRLPFNCLTSKRYIEKAGNVNPFSKKARARRAIKLRRFLPSKGEIIEGLQTTDQLFGIGICIGPIVGFAQDIIAGTVRTIMGQKVSWHGVPPEPSTPERNAMRTLRFAQTVGLARDIMTEEEHWAYLVALNGATQVLKPYFEQWDPFDQVEGLENVLFEAPRPEKPTTKAVLEEFGISADENIGWPGLNKREATAEELWDYYQKPAAESFYDFCERNRQNQVGSTGAQNAFEFGNNMMMFASGSDTVDVEYEPGFAGWYQWGASGCGRLGPSGGFRYSCSKRQDTLWYIGGYQIMVSG